MSGEGSEQRSGPAEAILARRSSRPEMPGWLLKEGADEEDESGSEYDPAEELPEPDEEAAEYEVDGVVRGQRIIGCFDMFLVRVARMDVEEWLVEGVDASAQLPSGEQSDSTRERP